MLQIKVCLRSMCYDFVFIYQNAALFRPLRYTMI